MSGAQQKLPQPPDLQGLLDIHPPPPPPGGPPWTLLLAGLLLAITVGLLWRLYRHPRRHARRQWRQLRHHCAAGHITPREGAHRLACILRTAVVEPGADDAAWRGFQQRLNAARFAAEGCDSITLAQLIEEGGKWLEAR